MMGAEVIFMPHVTGCLPSTMPGRGTVDRALWENRERDPVRLQLEFQGPKGRGWLMRWLPARAWENGVYAVFSNPVGLDDDTIKPGLAMILDPFGEVLAESRALGDDVVVALLTAEKLEQSSGRRYLRARRPELYGKLVEPPPPGQEPVTNPGWDLARTKPPCAHGRRDRDVVYDARRGSVSLLFARIVPRSSTRAEPTDQRTTDNGQTNMTPAARVGSIVLIEVFPADCRLGGHDRARDSPAVVRRRHRHRVPPPPLVTVVGSRRMTLPLVVNPIGTTRALNDVTIRARVKGFLKEKHFAGWRRMSRRVNSCS